MAANGLLDGIVAMWPLNNNIFDSLDVYASGGGGTTFPFSHVAGVTASTGVAKFLPGLAKAFGTSSANRMDFDDSVGQVFAAGDNDFTAMAWVWSFRGSNNPYLGKWPSDGVNNSWVLWNRSASQTHRLTISADGSATETVVEIANPDTTGGGGFWQLVVAGFDSVTQEVWMSLDASAKTRVSHTGGAFAGGNSRLSIGWFATLFGSHNQDESAYWDRQLSDADIAAIWAGGAGLRMTQWDATIPEGDGTGILTDLVSYYNMFDPSGGDRIDSNAGLNDLKEAGAGAPIDQGSGLPAIANTTANVDFSSNPSLVEYLEKVSPVNMGGGTDSFTICGFFEFDPKAASPQGLIKRWLTTGNQRQFLLTIRAGPSAIWRMHLSLNGANIISLDALEDFTTAPTGSSITRFAIAWYDDSDNKINIQLSDGPVVSGGGPASVFSSTQPFQVGRGDNGAIQPLVGGAAFLGYWRRVLPQKQRTFLYNFFGGRTFAELVAADSGDGPGAVDDAAYNYYWKDRRRRR